MTNTTHTSLLDGVEADAFWLSDKDLATTDLQWGKENPDLCEPLYCSHKIEALLEAQRVEYEARIEANRKEVLLEAAKEFDTMQGQEIHDTMTYRRCATTLRRMALWRR